MKGLTLGYLRGYVLLVLIRTVGFCSKASKTNQKSKFSYAPLFFVCLLLVPSPLVPTRYTMYEYLLINFEELFLIRGPLPPLLSSPCSKKAYTFFRQDSLPRLDSKRKYFSFDKISLRPRIVPTYHLNKCLSPRYHQ